MTVSSTPRSKKPDPTGRWLLAPALAVLMLVAGPVAAADPQSPQPSPPAVSSVPSGANTAPAPQLRREEGGWELNADLDVQLSPTLESALQRGLPLYFTVRFTVTKPRWYWLEAELADMRREYRVSYHALTRQYRVAIGSLALSYPTLAEAMRAVGTVHNWAVADASRFRSGERYRARLELRLDGSRLPKPLQINLLGSGDWTSDVEAEWEFAP